MDINYPVSQVKITNPTQEVIRLITSLENKPKIYFEIGSNIGSTAKKVRSILPSDSIVYLFDFQSNKKYIEDILDKNTLFFGSDENITYDSYNWHLIELYKQQIKPDFVFIDGKHTFDTDWLCFFMIDKMILPNGYIYFDDYNWCLETSPTMSPNKYPRIKTQYSNEQIASKHIGMLIDTFVKPEYKEIIPNKLYQK
jgi:hypothetical protein